MRRNTTLAWIVGVILVGSLMGCDRSAETTSVGEGLNAGVELTSATDLAQDGEVVAFNVMDGHGNETIHQYVKKNGKLEPIGDAPEMTLPEQHEVGVIPVSINGGSTYSHSATQERDRNPANNMEWFPNKVQSTVPKLQQDRSFRIETGSFVQQLENRGRLVRTKQFDTVGPSQAVELTRIQIDGNGTAELYQFDSPQALDAWYRVAYQLHESVGHDPEERIQINGMTMLRLGDNVDAEVPQAFLDSPKAVLLEK